MDNIKPTAPRQKEERPRMDKVVTGDVSVTKKSGFGTFIRSFFGDEEEISDLKTRIVTDMIVPTVKDIIMDTLGILLGVNGGRSRRRSTVERVSYGKYYEEPRRVAPARTSNVFNTDDVVFSSRGDAEQVLDRLYEIIERYGVARVTDLYDMAGLSVDYTAGKYGWTSLKNARVERVRDGYIIDLPRAMAID